MKKVKKLAALVLAMVMAFSLMAVTAAAYGEEEHDHDGVCCEETIQPRLPSEECPYCGQAMSTSFRWEGATRYIVFTCRTYGCGRGFNEYPYNP